MKAGLALPTGSASPISLKNQVLPSGVASRPVTMRLLTPPSLVKS